MNPHRGLVESAHPDSGGVVRCGADSAGVRAGMITEVLQGSTRSALRRWRRGQNFGGGVIMPAARPGTDLQVGLTAAFSCANHPHMSCENGTVEA